MKLEINPRGNGACPLCAAASDCRIRRLFSKAIEEAQAESEMEMVIYACPYFSERARA